MKTPDDLLSVIIPIYNTKEYLPRCLDSILDQTYPSLEIICVDDGSTDGSAELLDDYATKDSRIQVLHKSNGGSSSARKAGLSHATGIYTTFVDSDDWVDADMYKDLMEGIRLHDATVAISGIIRDYGERKIIDNVIVPEGHYSKERIQKEIVDYLINRNGLYKLPFSGSLCNKLFLTSYLREYQMPVPDEVHIYEDTVISVPMIANAESVYVSGMSYYHYCTRDDSKLNTKNTENIDRSISLSFDYMRTKADKAICDFYEMYCRLEMCIESVVFYENEELSFYGNIPKNSKLIVYGAGSFGKALRKRLTDLGLNVVAWADIRGDGENIIRPDQINDYEYDYIVIGAMLGDVITNIRRSLIEIGIPEDRIFSIHYL